MVSASKYVHNGTMVQWNIFVDTEQQKRVKMFFATTAAIRGLHIPAVYSYCTLHCSDWHHQKWPEHGAVVGEKNELHDSSVFSRDCGTSDLWKENVMMNMEIGVICTIREDTGSIYVIGCIVKVDCHTNKGGARGPLWICHCAYSRSFCVFLAWLVLLHIHQ